MESNLAQSERSRRQQRPGIVTPAALVRRLPLNAPDARTAAIPVPLGLHRAAIDVQDGNAGSAWSVELEFTLTQGTDEDHRDLTSWHSFSPAITIDAAIPVLSNIPIAGAGWLSVKVATADPLADPRANVVILLF
jgi:hypothetical protein